MFDDPVNRAHLNIQNTNVRFDYLMKRSFDLLTLDVVSKKHSLLASVKRLSLN